MINHRNIISTCSMWVITASIPVLIFLLIEGILNIADFDFYSTEVAFKRFDDYQVLHSISEELGSDLRQNGLYKPYQSESYYINSHGVRTKEFSQKKKNEDRTVVLGGSTVWGSSVSNHHTIPGFLEVILKRELPHNVITVYNLGVEGYTFADELELITKFFHLIQPNQLVFYHGANDNTLNYLYLIGAQNENHSGKSILVEKKTTMNWIKSSLRKLEIYKVLSFFIRSQIGNKSRLEIGRDLYEERLNKIVNNYFEQNLKAMRFCNEKKVTCYFILQPLIFHKQPLTRIEKTLVHRRLKKEPGLDTLYDDFVDRIMAKNKANTVSEACNIFDFRMVLRGVEDILFGDFVHVNQHANQIIAEKIGDTLMKYRSSVDAD
ncbi:MAG: SGNH/GDSL hydrolase family protein [SAR324 cluster bacterium]|nr:SGNH/GDSL hydrolase family protein [SAR324 cluster bacterium]